jgi:hypothetical protein
MKNVFILAICVILIFACTTAQINQTLGTVNEALNTESAPTTNEVGAGLKEALIKGISKGSDQVSQLDGYFKNPKIKIPFPPGVQKVETKLRQLGLDSQVDKFVMTLNRGAEDAAKSAKPIFVSAITSMTIADAWNILKGEKNAATNYLKKTTSDQLIQKFRPVMASSLDKVNATKYYADVIGTYNKIPFVDKVNPDLKEYATQKAVDGLFFMIAKEEKNIREDPIARTTELLKKVFGSK